VGSARNCCPQSLPRDDSIGSAVMVSSPASSPTSKLLKKSFLPFDPLLFFSLDLMLKIQL
jgi:hypothetical protein